MKNKLLIFFLLNALSLSSKAQYFENKLHFQFSYGVVKTMGNKDVNEAGFVLPSLYANYTRNSQFSFRTTFKIKPIWSVGVDFNQTKFGSWKYAGEDLFDNSSSTLTRFGIVLKIHTKFKYEGIFNKMQLYTMLSPFYTNLTLTLQQPPVSLPDNMGTIERNSNTWGFNSNMGIIYSISRNLSLFSEEGFLLTKLESQLHNDKYLKAFYINFGFCFQFVKPRSVTKSL